VEAHELAHQRTAVDKTPLSGVTHQRQMVEGVEVTRIHVHNRDGAKAMGKPLGHYVTLFSPAMRRHDPEAHTDVARLLAEELQGLMKLPKNARVLVVGLGNSHVTPDALGPKVVERIFVTRHLFESMPQTVGDGYRVVSAVAPGVLGITGIETGEIIHGIVEHVHPDAVVAVDALASRSLSRVNATVQLTDTGIQPGSGVGNKRKVLDALTLGCKVFAIGVPTVVDAATIANDAMDLVLRQLADAVPGNGANAVFDPLSGQEKWLLIQELLEPMENNLMVTPKEVDQFIEDTADTLARGLNMALHPSVTAEEAAALSK
jgi:spore protease